MRSYAKSSLLDQVQQLIDAWRLCRQDPKDWKAYLCFRKDIVRNIRRYLREDCSLLEVPDFKSLRQALEFDDIPFGESQSIWDRLQFCVGREWEVMDFPWKQISPGALMKAMIDNL